MEFTFETVTILLVAFFVVIILAFLFYNVIINSNEFNQNSKWVMIATLFCWMSFSLWYAITIGAGRGIFIFIITPILISSAFSFFYSLKKILEKMPAHWLIFLQIYRIEGFIFIYAYFTQGQLSKGFAFNAGIGDVLTGLLAIPVGWIVMNKVKKYQKAIILWNLFGIADLIVAPASAIYFGANGLGSFPLLFVPIFLGPPLGISLHILSLRQIYLHKEISKINSQKNLAN